MPDQNYHYHADLDCGHNVSFDVPMDLIADAKEQGAEAQVELPCRDCGRQSQSRTLTLVGLASEPCECKS